MTSNVDNEHPSDHFLTEITRFENVFGSPLTYESRECFVQPGNREPFIQMFSFEHICASSWWWLFPCVLSALYCFLFSDMTINIYSKSLYFYIIFGSITGLLFYKFKIQKESLIVVRGVGLLFESYSGIGNKTTSFIAWESLNDFVIFEAFRQGKILYYLGILKKDTTRKSTPEEKVSTLEDKVSTPGDKVSTPEDKVSAPEDKVRKPDLYNIFPLFTGSTPRLKNVQDIYRKLAYLRPDHG